MKILWLSHLIPYPPKGGVLQRSYNLIKELAKYHEIDLLAFNQLSLINSFYNSTEEGLNEAKSVLEKICKQVLFFEIPIDNYRWGKYVLALKSLVYKPYNINWLKSNAFKIKLKKWINKYDYDLVHFDTISLVPYFFFVPSNIHTSLDHHNIESHMLLRRAHNEINLFKRYYFLYESVRLSRYECNFAPRFTINIVCSDIDSKRLNSLAPKAKIYTIPNGVDLDYFKPIGLSKQLNRLIFVGRMSAYPNIEAVSYIAKNIWPKLKQMHPNLICDIIGSKPPREIYEFGNQLNDFHIHGYVEDVRPFIEAATVYLCPIRNGGGTKLKILDAMAMEKAIVAHPIACEGISVNHNEHVMLAINDQQFITYIDQLLQDTQKRENLGSAARKLIENKYSFNVIGKICSDVFQSLPQADF
jgi:glycosyltransferase involved in cell wall biosynthesis